MRPQLDISCFGHPFTGYPLCDGSADCILNVHDSPYISLKRASELADEAQISGQSLFKELHDSSLKKVISKFHAALCEHFTFNSIIEERNIGRIGDHTEVFDGNIGFKIRKTYSKYQSLHLSYLVIKSDVDTTKTITIQDDCGTDNSITVKLKCGFNKVNVDYYTQGGEVSIYINSCDILLANSYTNNNYCRDYPDCKNTYGCYYQCGCFEIEEFKDNGTTRTLTDTGLYLSVRCVANPYQLICDYKHLLQEPHQLYFEYMIHQTHVATTRMNPFARNSKEDADNRMKEIMGGEINGFVVERPEFQEAMKVAVKSAVNSICQEDIAESEGNKIVTVIP